MLVDNLRAVLEAVELEIAQARQSQERMMVLARTLEEAIAEHTGGTDRETQVPAPEPVSAPAVDEEVDFEELRRLATHKALTALRSGEKDAVVAALEAAGGSRVSELEDSQLQPFLEVLGRSM